MSQENNIASAARNLRVTPVEELMGEPVTGSQNSQVRSAEKTEKVRIETLGGQEYRVVAKGSEKVVLADKATCFL